jgi:hypothetical protein
MILTTRAAKVVVRHSSTYKDRAKGDKNYIC